MKRKGFWIVLFAVLLALSSVAMVACGNKGDNGTSTSTHTVTFVGTNDAVITVNDGGYVTLPEPTREGYTFAGWFTDSTFSTRYYGDEPVKSDITLYAYWQDGATAKYTIRFFTTQLVGEKEVDAGGTLKYSQFPILTQRDGYVAYWKLGDAIVNSDLIGVDRNMDIYAVYEPESEVKTVTFDSRGGSDVSAQIVKIGEKAKYPVEPSKEGYFFVGWFDETRVEYNFDSPVLNNITLYADWSENEPPAENGKVVTYSIPKIVGDFNGWDYNAAQTWSAYGGRTGVYFNPLCDTRLIIVYSKVYVEGTGWTFNEAYNFSGARIGADLTNASRVEKNSSVNDYYVAVIRAADKQFSLDRYRGGRIDSRYDADSGILQIRDVHRVRFETNGGSSVVTQYISDGDCAAVPAAPTQIGKIFASWTNRSGIEVNIATQAIMSDTVFYAKWDEAYIVTFDTHGGTEVPPQTVSKSDSHVTKPPQPTKDGYYFDGWYTEISYEYEFDFEKEEIKGTSTLHAKWEPIVLGQRKTVTFDYRGGTVSETQSLTVEAISGRTISPLLYSPKKSGQYLKGWYKDKQCSDSEIFNFDDPIYKDMTLYAGYADIPSGYYVVYYDCSPRMPEKARVGSDVRSYSITGDTTYNVLREGYDFAGWYNDKACSDKAAEWPRGDSGNVVTLYAKWDARIEYTYTYYKHDGSVYKTEKYRQNRVVAYSELAEPYERMGYSFNGWYRDKSCTDKFPDSVTVTGPVSLYPSWVEGVAKRVIFYDMDGKELSRGLLHDGTHEKSEFETLYNPEGAGYVFNHWFGDRERTTPLPANYKISKDVNLYGSWIESGSVAPTGKGTKNSPWLVSSYNQFAAHLLSGGNMKERYYKFTADVNFTNGNELLPEIYASVDFDGHSVRGVTRPMFESIGYDAKVCNAKIDVNITKVNRETYVGGVCNYLYGKIELIWLTGTVNLPNVTFVGGIAGKTPDYKALIKNCLNQAGVTARDYAGGIIGSNTCNDNKYNGLGSPVRFCVNEGVTTAIEGSYDTYFKKNFKHAGGIAGACLGFHIVGCVTTVDNQGMQFNPDGKPSTGFPIYGENKGGTVFSPSGTPGSSPNGNCGQNKNSIPDLLKNWLNWTYGVSDTTFVDGLGNPTAADREIDKFINYDDEAFKNSKSNAGTWYNDNGKLRLTYFKNK